MRPGALCDGGSGPMVLISKHRRSRVRLRFSDKDPNLNDRSHSHTLSETRGVRKKNPSPNLPIAMSDVTGDGAPSLAENSMLGGVVC